MKEYTANKQLQKGAYNMMYSILDPATDDEDIYQFLTNRKPESVTVDELIGFVKRMKEKAKHIKPHVGTLVDTCGTGGDCKGTTNVSTDAALLASSAGIAIAKHGNYSVTSKSGSANVLEASGYNIHMSPNKCKKMIEDIGFGFLFAPTFHPAMARVKDIRQEIKEKTGKKTIFNLLGPLCNPANANAQLIGVYNKNLCEKFCYVLREFEVKRALVVYGSGLDEISNLDETFVSELKNGDVNSYVIRPEDYRLKRYKLKDIAGGSPEENAKYRKAVFNGEKGTIRDMKGDVRNLSAMRDITIMNAGAAIYLGGGANSLREGISEAKEAIDSGIASIHLDRIIECSNR